MPKKSVQITLDEDQQIALCNLMSTLSINESVLKDLEDGEAPEVSVWDAMESGREVLSDLVKQFTV